MPEVDSETIIIKDGKLAANIDNETIVYNSVEDFMEVPHQILNTENGIYTRESEGELYIGANVDNKTIFINNAGQLEGAPNVLVDDETIHINSENVISVNIDNETIVYDEENDWLEVAHRMLQTENGIYAREDSEVLFIGVLNDDKTIKANSEGYLGINIDNDTIVYNNTRDWIEVPHQFLETENGLYVRETSEGVAIGAFVDDKTIFINSEGQLEGAPNVKVDNRTIVIDSENVISVPIDEQTIIYNEDQEWLEVSNKDIKPESGIYFRDSSEALYIGVNVDGETILVDSEGRLVGAPNVECDERTIIHNSEGKIQVAYDHNTIVFNEDDKWLEVDGIEITPIAPIYIKDDTSESGNYFLGCGYDNVTITLNEKNELQTAIGGGWRCDPEERIIATGTNAPKHRHHMLPDDDADYFLETV